MDISVIGCTYEVDTLTGQDLINCKIFSGKNAGICYMRDSYFNSAVSDSTKALERFRKVIATGHHSIADHVRVEVLFGNISKMLAIVLNSLQDYSTSEKSGRYTVMNGSNEREVELYNKWRVLYKNRILELYPDIDDTELIKQMSSKGHSDVIITDGKLNNNSMADFDEVHQNLLRAIKSNCSTLPSTKLAQENARYILSVFTRSTTMGYSTSLRQWNYIYDWCNKYMSRFVYHHGITDGHPILVYQGTTTEASYFEQELYRDLSELASYIKANLYISDLRDTKSRYFEFLTNLSGDNTHPMSLYNILDDDSVGDVYSVSYYGSFVQIAQAERHRTLKYFMQFNPNATKLDFVVPKCIRGTDLESEWLSDLNSVKDLVPQATKIGIIETGHISDFILKCKERLCGRAQLEIMEQTEKTASKFIDNESSSRVFEAYVNKLKNNNITAKTKCQMLGGCKEPCQWGYTEAFTRLI